MPNKQQKKIILINNCIEISIGDSDGAFSSIKISVPKKIVKSAVQRNKIKRQIKEIYRCNFQKNLNKNLIILNNFDKEIKKTKEIYKIFVKLNINNSLLILDKKSYDKINKATKNLPNIKTTDVNHFSAYDLVKFKKTVFTESSIKELEKRYQ